MSRSVRDNYVRVLSETTISSIGATREQRQAALRADLEAMVAAKKRGEEAAQAEAIQQEFGLDQLEPLPRELQGLPLHFLDQPTEKSSLPYYLKDN